jgi:hypothetical protein
MEEEKQELEGATGAARRRLVIGVGFSEQGFRLFPCLVVNFFLKDGMGVVPPCCRSSRPPPTCPWSPSRSLASSRMSSPYECHTLMAVCPLGHSLLLSCTEYSVFPN